MKIDPEIIPFKTTQEIPISNLEIDTETEYIKKNSKRTFKLKKTKKGEICKKKHKLKKKIKYDECLLLCREKLNIKKILSDLNKESKKKC